MGKRILIVEDVEDSRAILVLILQRFCGYETIEAVNGTEALKKALSEKPDLIVMDLGLPDIDGVSTARVLKANPITAPIPIIAHTAWSSAQWEEAAFKAGMVKYLQKPVPKEVMKQTIAEFIAA